jgi:hypothetical protein
MEIPEAGLLAATFNRRAGTADSFSPREKDRLRGKSTRIDTAAPSLLELG